MIKTQMTSRKEFPQLDKDHLQSIQVLSYLMWKTQCFVPKESNKDSTLNIPGSTSQCKSHNARKQEKQIKKTDWKGIKLSPFIYDILIYKKNPEGKTFQI